MIEKPSYYHKGKIDVITFAKDHYPKEQIAGFFRMNILKYVDRYQDKNGLEDLKKARNYLDMLIELEGGKMINKERLEEIKSRVWKDKGTYAMGDYSQREGYIYTLSDYDYEWLIEQAERVQEVEEELKELRAMYSVVNGERIRYKQALEFYADEENYCVRFEDDYEPILQDNGKTARQSLEGDND